MPDAENGLLSVWNGFGGSVSPFRSVLLAGVMWFNDYYILLIKLEMLDQQAR